MNYYPSQNGWTLMWTNWDQGTLTRDFRTIRGLSANAVRLIIQPAVFGFPNPSDLMLSRLRSTISIARASGLQVQLTLFDGFSGDSNYLKTGDSANWMRAVVAPYRNDPEVAFVELQNEINPTYPSAMNWARNMLPLLKSAVGTVLVTVSVYGSGDPRYLQQLKSALAADPPDFYDVHFYGVPSIAFGELSQDKAIAAPLPLFVGETGDSTYVAPGSGQTGGASSTVASEANQDYYFRAVEWATRALHLPAAAPWILQDFTASAIPPYVGGGPAQYDFGLYRTSGSAKPAASTIRALFSTGVIDTSFNNGFEIGSNGQPADWLTLDASQGHLSWDRTVSHSGSASVRMSQTSGSASMVPSYYSVPIVAATRPGQNFNATVWAKGGNSTGDNRIAIAWYGLLGNFIYQTESFDLPSGTTGWIQLNVSASVPSGAAFPEITLKSSNNTGSVWFDDVRVTTSN